MVLRQISLYLLLCSLIYIVPLITFPTQTGTIAAPSQATTVYLPLVRGPSPQPVPFGFETHQRWLLNSTIRAAAEELDAAWVRLNEISWREIQPEPDLPPEQWNWQTLATFERELLVAAELGITPIVVVDDSPRWATLYETSCGPLHEDHFEDFARFMQELVHRYKDAPYHIHYWELGNEIDVGYDRVPVDNHYGCWGEVDDPYYGGERYGRMLNVVTPAIRQADPQAQVSIGGLLLGDPDVTEWYPGSPHLFFEGILRAGAGDNFDVIAYHSYPYYELWRGDRLTREPDRFDSRWADWGGMSVGKTRFLNSFLERYEVDAKPFSLNEAALIMVDGQGGAVPTDDFLQAQADHIVRLMARAMEMDIQSLSWYTLQGPGWRSNALLDENQQPRPAYHAYLRFRRHTQPSIDTVTVSHEYNRDLASDEAASDPIEAYRFLGVHNQIHPHHYVDVLWSYTPTRITISRTETLAVYTRDGALLPSVSETDTTVTYDVSLVPIYIHRLYSGAVDEDDDSPYLPAPDLSS